MTDKKPSDPCSRDFPSLQVHVNSYNLWNIADEIVNFAKSIKIEENNIVISCILNNKAKEVNLHLKEKCEVNNLSLIEHHNISPYRHINAKVLHLNNYGDNQLIKNFTRFIENG